MRNDESIPQRPPHVPDADASDERRLGDWIERNRDAIVAAALEALASGEPTPLEPDWKQRVREGRFAEAVKR